MFTGICGVLSRKCSSPHSQEMSSFSKLSISSAHTLVRGLRRCLTGKCPVWVSFSRSVRNGRVGWRCSDSRKNPTFGARPTGLGLALKAYWTSHANAAFPKVSFQSTSMISMAHDGTNPVGVDDRAIDPLYSEPQRSSSRSHKGVVFSP